MTADADDAPFPELDPVIHAQPRLRIVVALATLGAGDRVTFPRLQELVGMTPGNLSTHLRKLEDAGYVAVEKSFRNRTPVTWLSVTRRGRRAFEDYTAAVQRLLQPPGPATDEPAGNVSLATSANDRRAVASTTEPEEGPAP